MHGPAPIFSQPSLSGFRIREVFFCKKGLDNWRLMWYIYYVDSCMKTYGDKEMIKSLSIISVILIGLTGCQMNNKTAGSAVGGLAGGLLGNTLGKGGGNIAATIGGAVLGTVVGGSVGESMDTQQELNQNR